MIYLLTNYLGGDNFHRRDSDCFVLHLDRKKYPIHQEIEYLSKDVNKIRKSKFNSEDKIYIIGSDYYGNWNLDLHQLQEKDPSTLTKLYKLSNFPSEEIPKVVEAKYLHNDYVHNKNAVLDDGLELLYNWPEAGNISMYEIFKWIPNFIGSNAIGFDYHTYNIAYICGLPTMYHYHKIYHVHDQTRYHLEMQKKYWKGILKLNDYNILLKHFSDFYKVHTIASGFTNLKNLILSGQIVSIFNSLLDNITIDERLETMDYFIHEILLSQYQDAYTHIGYWLQEHKMEIINELNMDYKQSIELQSYWVQIIKSTTGKANINKSFKMKRY